MDNLVDRTDEITSVESRFILNQTNCSCVTSGTRSKYTCLKCRYMCCENAEEVHCVCLYSYKCKNHTNNLAVCIGSHS